MSAKVYLLFGAGHSGRAVKLRTIGIDEDDQAQLSVMTEAKGDAKLFQILGERERVCRMIDAVTDPVPVPQPTGKDDKRDDHTRTLDAVRALQAKAWKKTAVTDLQDPTSKLCYKKLFTIKDDVALQSLSRFEHMITPMELEAIMGKAIPVSED